MQNIGHYRGGGGHFLFYFILIQGKNSLLVHIFWAYFSFGP